MRAHTAASARRSPLGAPHAGALAARAPAAIVSLAADAPHRFYTWNKWGRVGEERGMQNACRGPMDKEAAKKDFATKFSDKTKNQWAARAWALWRRSAARPRGCRSC